MKLKVFNLKGVKQPEWDIDIKPLGTVNNDLLSQAIRVYTHNSHQKTSKVKTRGEVEGSTRKIYRQKGTGNARHGARYAPIFVGGGIAHGPKGVRPQNLVLPKKMRTKALAVALLLKFQESNISGFTGESEKSLKTSSMVDFLQKVSGHPETRVTLITNDRADGVYRAVRNLQDVIIKRASLINALDVVSSGHLLVSRDALASLVGRASGKREEAKGAK